MSAVHGRRVAHGFDYIKGVELTLSLKEWRAMVRKIENEGGRTKRLAGDLITFNKQGRMLFEVYDRANENRFKTE